MIYSWVLMIIVLVVFILARRPSRAVIYEKNDSGQSGMSRLQDLKTGSRFRFIRGCGWDRITYDDTKTWEIFVNNSNQPSIVIGCGTEAVSVGRGGKTALTQVRVV